MTVSEALSLAYEHHCSGRLSVAEQIYLQILQVDPGHAVATHRLGLIAQQTGNPTEADRFYRRAIAQNPHYPDVYVDLAGLLRQQGSVEEAIEVYRHALTLDPRSTIAHHNMGDTLTERGDLEEALGCFERALELRPDLAESHSSLGNLLKMQGQPDAAIARYRRALELKPHYAPAHNNLGVVLSEQGDKTQAITCFQKGIELAPGDADAYNNLGRTLCDVGRHDEAVAYCRRAIELKPRFREAQANLGKAYIEQRRFQDAESCFRAELEVGSDDPDVYLRLGNALMEQDRVSEAKACYQRVLELKPESPEAYCNLGMTLLSDDDYAGAIERFRRSLELKPDYVEAHYNLADTLLTIGDYVDGFREYDYRWKRAETKRPNHVQPQWSGESLVGKTILLVCEQGLGDTIQFIRFASLVKQQGATVLFACVRPLVKLLAKVPGVDRVIPEGDPLPAFDVYAPLMSLPALLGVKLNQIPDVLPVPYLQAEKTDRHYWKQRLGPRLPGEVRVGIAWQGNPKHVRDRYRSIPLASLVPLASVPGIRLISFQKNLGTEQIAPLQDRMKIDCFEQGPRPDVDSFQDSAALMSLMDVVVTIDSAPVHLAGAVGVPAWLLCPVNPEWRWLVGRDDSPWYPSVRIFRQTRRNQWDDVVARMVRELTLLSARMAGGGDSSGEWVSESLSTANEYLRTGQLARCRELCLQVVRACPDHSQAWHLLGNVASQTGHLGEAMDFYRRSLAIQPDRAQVYCDLGLALRRLGQNLEAISAFQNALEWDPGLSIAHHGLGECLMDAGRYDEAGAIYLRALERWPGVSGTHGALGHAFMRQGKRDAAIEQFRRAIELDPMNQAAHNNLGVSLNEKAQVPEAIECFQRAIACSTPLADAHHNLGHALLSLGDYVNGFREFEYRWKLQGSHQFSFEQPVWKGKSIAGKTILVCCEFGLGDTIQFVRFLTLLKARGATVLLGCFKPLAKLLSQVPGLDILVAEGDPIPPFDYYVPLLSLPSILKTRLEDIPCLLPAPYLKPQLPLVEYWRDRLGPRQPGEIRVGIAWQGNPAHVGDRFRSIPLSEFIPLASVPGVRLINFQRNFGAEQIEANAYRLCVTRLERESGNEVDSFQDTAALLSLMDVMISVDSAPVHLAGALGVRTWLLCPLNADWRWMRDREETPWYPSVRIFRQSALLEWESLFERLTRELTMLARECS